jgi:FkbM family methyltransferase
MFYKIVNAYTRRFSFPHRGLKYFLKAAHWLGIANKTYRKTLPGNFFMELNPTEHIQQQLFWYGYYEKDLVDLIRTILRPNNVFLDVGANVGYFSLYAAINDPTARVFAFEPVKELFEKLEKNISINHLENIQPIRAAVGERNEEKEMFLSGDDNKGMSSFRKPENFSGKTEKVKVMSIDDWLVVSGIGRIDVIKMDIEGSELAALKGMKKTLQSIRPLLIVEINPGTLSLFGLSPADIYDFLTDLDFSGYLISSNGRLHPLTQFPDTRNVFFVPAEKAELLSALIRS